LITALRTPADGRWYRLSAVSLVVFAWIVLAAWGASPFAPLLSHRELAGGGLTALRLAVFTAGWLLMAIAMMLPGSLPLVTLFRVLVAPRPDRARLTAALIAGYLAAWTAFGAAAFAGDAALHAAVLRSPLAAALSAWIGLAVLLAAGVYQVTPLKDVCLEKCRSPYSFLMEHWRGRRPLGDALRLGLRHGAFCVGCCWVLMLVMFAVGGVNLAWMLGLAAVMLAERTSRWGRRLTVPVGAALILCAIGLAVRVPFLLAAFGGD
jgi:predicted metal-binding membrane protein